jgi:sterol desaturase/sphingolipid hydroxylase (fatty acid hydroxylase superfamily)
MPRHSRRSYAYFDTDDSLDEQIPRDPTMAGLPETWRHYGWMVAAVVLAGLWLVEILTSGALLDGMMGLSHVAKGIWAFVIVLTGCASLFYFWNRRKPRLGHTLCFLIAVTALVSYAS